MHLPCRLNDAQVNNFDPFIVMESIFPLKAGVPINLVYDLKGSWHGREIKEKEKLAKVIIYKDNDFENDAHRSFKLDQKRRYHTLYAAYS